MLIELTGGNKAIVDDNFANLNQYKWYYHNGYGRRKFTDKYGNQKSMYLHHAVIGFPLKGMVVDHINRNKLDNRVENLRIVTQRENVRNSNRCVTNYEGITWHENGWQAQICIDGKNYYLGRSKDKEVAMRMYQQQKLLLEV